MNLLELASAVSEALTQASANHIAPERIEVKGLLLEVQPPKWVPVVEANAYTYHDPGEVNMAFALALKEN